MVPVQLITGRLPKDGSEVLMPSHLLSDINLDCAVGDTLDLAVGLFHAFSCTPFYHLSTLHTISKFSNRL